MRRPLTATTTAALLLLAGGAVSLAQDTPTPPPPAPEDAAGAPESDPAALELLAAASARQGGASLALPDGLRSFSILFRQIKVFRYTQGEDGSWTKANEVADSMSIDWMRHAGNDSSLRTFWEINGQKVWRCVYAPREAFWLSDGQEITNLSPGTHDADREEVLLHRRLSETLLDVAVLHKLRTDGSIWKRVDDALHAGIALRRTPAPGLGGLTFTIWLDPATSDPRHVRVEPVEDDAPLLHYELTYQDDLPEEIFSVEGADLRFPRRVVVREQLPDLPAREVMSMFVKRVVFNRVEPDVFKPASTLGR